MGLTREERKLMHTKQGKVQASVTRPTPSSMNEGDSILGFKNRNLYQFTRHGGVLYEVKLKKSIDSERVTKADSSWNVANLINSWTDYSADYQGASFFKDSNGIVHIRGLIKDGSSTTAVMFVLPSGYRPGNREIFNTYSNNGATRLDVKIDGSVLAQSNASTTWTSLSGISFSALKIR